MGYKVPEDVIVTGFDNTYNAKHHLPALTTVSRPLDEAGYKACEVILKVIKGKKQKGTIALKSSPVFTESCGCRGNGITSSDALAIQKYLLGLIKTLPES